MSMTLEICVDTPQGLADAVAGGADRIELCAALDVGGLTPAPGLISLAARAPVPVYMMIRPRAGNFCFSTAEEEAMLADIAAAQQAGLAGIVIGASHPDGRLDTALLARLISHADGLGITLHRAFDLVPEPLTALEQAMALGVERILTSGQAPTAEQGLPLLQQLQAKAAARITIMPGSGVTASNAARILAQTGATELHASGRIPQTESDSRAVELGFAPAKPRITSSSAIRDLKQILARWTAL